MANPTFTLPSADVITWTNGIRWDPDTRPLWFRSASPYSPSDAYLERLAIYTAGGGAGYIFMRLSTTATNSTWVALTLASIASIRLRLSDGYTLTTAIGGADNPHYWFADAQAFGLRARGLADQTLTVEFIPAPPTLSLARSASLVEYGEDPLTLTATASDPTGRTLSYAWSSSLGDAPTPADKAVAKWSPPRVSVLSHVVFTCRVTAGDDSVTKTITAFAAPEHIGPLALPTPAAQSTATGAIAAVTLPEADEGYPPYIYSADDLPDGLALLGRTVRGIPTTPGSYTVTYRVTDAALTEVTKTFTWTVTGAALPAPPGLNLRVDWGGLYYSSAYADVTDRIVSAIECDRGRGEPWGRSRAGRLRVQLDSSDGRFDASDSTSPLAGLIWPGTRVQLRDGRTPIWTGYLDDLDTRFVDGGHRRATLTALGAVSRAVERDTAAHTTANEGTSTYGAMVILADRAGVETASEPSPDPTYVLGRWWESGSLWDALADIEATEDGWIIEDAAGRLDMLPGGWRDGQTDAITLSAAPVVSGETEIIRLPQRWLELRGIANRVTGLTRDASTTAQTARQVVAVAHTTPLDVRLRAGDAVASASVTKSVSPSKWASAVTASVAVDHQDTHVMIVSLDYVSTDADAPATVTVTVTVTFQAASSDERIEVVAEDAESIGRYGLRSQRIEDTWLDAPAMRTRVDDELARSKSPRLRWRASWAVRQWADYHALELGDQVSIDVGDGAQTGYIDALALEVPIAGTPVCTMDISE